jgi:uncharacterized membrane protein
MKAVFNSLRTYTVRGALAVTPLILTFLVLRFLYRVLDYSIIGQIDTILGVKIPGPWVGVVVFIGLLYVIGIIASNVIGRQFFGLVENISERIPIVKAIYQVGKQLSSTLALSERQAIQKVVLLEYFHVGVLNIGFVTGVMKDQQTGEEIYKVLIPTVPNPLSGFIVFAKSSQIVDPKWSVEDGLKIVISGGIIGPDRLK